MEHEYLTGKARADASSSPTSPGCAKLEKAIISSPLDGVEHLDIRKESSSPHKEKGSLTHEPHVVKVVTERERSANETVGEGKEADPVFDGTENPDTDPAKNLSGHSLECKTEGPGYAWLEKAAALKDFVKEQGAIAVSNILRRLSGKRDESEVEDIIDNAVVVDESVDPNMGSKSREDSHKGGNRSTWNPLNYIKITREPDKKMNMDQQEGAHLNNQTKGPAMKGRVTLYTRLGCHECRLMRLFLHQKCIKPVEINIDVFPGRKIELEKITGSSTVPKVFFNDIFVGGMSEIKDMEDSGKLDEKLNDLMNTEPSPTTPSPPFSGEDDDISSSGVVDELALIVRKMKETIVLKDRFYKMRRFNNCFLGSEAVDFLSEDQYFEREEAVEFAQQLVEKFFIHHVLDEDGFEDGNQPYRFLDHDPVILSQCYNIPRGIIDVKPKPISEISSRLRLISCAIIEAYVSDDGRHADYRSIRYCEEFARYLRIVEELQRVELLNTSREEKLAFFINIYNMMAIHAILSWGYPAGPLERRKFLGEFKYVIGGYTYSLSAIQNGILRGNQRPPYNLIKPFGLKDKRAQVALPYPEPLVHFALVCGSKSGPSLRCYSPVNIDKELVEAARDFISHGGVVFDVETKVASVSKILRWYSVDFGKNEIELIKHAANYLDTSKSRAVLELLAGSQMKVVYQPYDWTLNC